MARVPIDNLPGVAPGEMPGVRISPNAPEAAFGGGQDAAQSFGQARGLANDIMKEQEEVRQRADLAAVFKATAELSNYTTDLQYNPQTGIVAQKGENAFPLAKSIPEQHRKKVSELMGTLSSPEQRQVFQRQAEQNFQSLNGFNQRHIAGQSEHFMAQQADAIVDAHQKAGANAGFSLDFEGIHKAAGEVYGARMAYGQKNGIPPEMAKGMADTDTSRTYTGAIISMLDAKQDMAASKFFAENSSKLTPEDRHRLAGPLKLGSILGESQRTVDSYFAGEMVGVPTGGNNWVQQRSEPVKTMADVIAKSKNIESPEVRAEVERLARQRFADIHMAERQQNETAFMGIAKLIEQNPGVDPRTLATPDQWENQLTPDLKNDLKKLAYPKEEMERLALTNLVLTPDNELKGYSDAQVLGKFGAHMYKQAIDRRDAIRKGGPAYDANALHDATLMSVFVKSGLGGVKPDDTAEDIKKTPAKQAALYQFWDTVEKGRAADQLASGKKADDLTTRKKAEEAALLLNKKLTITNRTKVNAEDVLSEIIPGYGFIRGDGKYQTALGSLTPDEVNSGEIEIPMDFVQTVFNRAKARPSTVPQGVEMGNWIEKDRGHLNRAYLAFLAGGTNAEVFAAYLKGK